MVIRDDGQVAGSVSGGCIEDDLISRQMRGELTIQKPQTVTYGSTAEEAHRFGLPCGGTVQIVLECLSLDSRLDALLSAIQSHSLVRRVLDVETGQATIAEARLDDRMSFDGHLLTTVHGPQMRLLVIGGGQLSRYLASMANMLGYNVTVCEPRTEYHEGWEALPGVKLSTLMPDDLVLDMKLDATCAVVAVTHDPKLDDLALMEALRTDAFYIAALGSRRNNESRRARLVEHFDLTESDVTRLRGPAGFNMGAETPSEIALSIIAEMHALRKGVDLNKPINDWHGSTSICRT